MAGLDGVNVATDLDVAEADALVAQGDADAGIGRCWFGVQMHEIGEGVDECRGGHGEDCEGRIDHWSFPFVANLIAC